MSDKQKKAIDDNCNTEAAGASASPGARWRTPAIDKIKAESGHEVYKLTPEQIAAVEEGRRTAGQDLGEGVKKNGGDPDAALAELKASLTKYNALAQ